MYPTENLTARVYSLYADIVQRAADRAGKSVSAYIGDIVVPWAASDLGERMPKLPTVAERNYRSVLEQAAKRAGMTPAQWERHAAETLSAQVLGMPTPDDARAPGRPPTVPPPSGNRHGSGERVALRIGGYAKAEQAPEVIRRRRQA